MEALSASIFVDRAISSMIMIFSAICFIASTACSTALPPASAPSADFRAIDSVFCAFSAFCFMFALICSMEADISSTDAACSVAPCEICWDVALSCSLPADTWLAASTTFLTTSLRLRAISSRLLPRSPSSSFRASIFSRCRASKLAMVKSPLAKSPMARLIALMGVVMVRAIAKDMNIERMMAKIAKPMMGRAMRFAVAVISAVGKLMPSFQPGVFGTDTK